MVVESGRFDWSQGDRFPSLTEPEPAYHGLKFFENFGDFAFTTKARAVALRDFGPTLSPMNAFLTMTGIESLHVRMDRHVENATEGRRVSRRPPEGRLGLLCRARRRARITSWRRNTCRRAPARSSPSASRAATRPAIRLVESVRLFSHLANIGDTRSLILHPASTTHRQLSDEQRVAAGAGPDVVRLSIGLETADDLIRDLDQALVGDPYLCECVRAVLIAGARNLVAKAHRDARSPHRRSKAPPERACVRVTVPLQAR